MLAVVWKEQFQTIDLCNLEDLYKIYTLSTSKNFET